MESNHITRRIADLDNDDKPREKALNQGIEHLTNAELLAILLGSGMKGLSVIDLSRDILKGCDNKLSRLARVSVHELMSKYKGVGAAKAITLLAAIELGTRCVHSFHLDNDVEPRVTSSNVANHYIRQKLERNNHEQFWVLYLDNSNKIIASECVSRGGVASTVVDIKIVLKSALDKLASGLILVHNHPSGNLKPSAPDDNLTNKIKEGARLIDIRVLDHIIIAPQGYYSYADEGRL